MPPARLPTLTDVAHAAGLSRATVSRYVNNPAAVRADGRARIERAIDKLGYVPHGAARALASHRSHMIGALFPSLDSILFGRFIAPLQTRLRQLKYTLVVSSSDYLAEMEYEQLRVLATNGVDAIMMVGTEHDERCFDLLDRRRIPFVLTWSWDETKDLPQVGFCNATAAGMAANYLIDIGHHRIAMISGLTKGNDRARERVRGVRAALAKRNLELRQDYLVEKRFDLREGGAGIRELMSRPEPPTAIICGSDLFAYGAIFEASRMGLRVPEDVSITGFDDTEFAASMAPSLTTISTPRVRMAELTAEYLLAVLTDKETPRPGRLNVELIIRESTAPPR